MTTNADLQSAARERLIGLLRKPKQAQKEKKPLNKRWLAWLGFNSVMAFIDLISAVTVASMIGSVLYGVLTFLSGFLALMVAEQLFTNPYADQTQKIIAIASGVIAIVSTFGIGIAAGIVNVARLTQIIPVSAIETVVIVSMVVIATIHGILWGFYYFMDEGHIRAMKAMQNAAFREQQRQDIDDARRDVEAVKAIAKEIEAMGNDDAALLAEAYRENTGMSLYYQGDAEDEADRRPAAPVTATPAAAISPAPVLTGMGLNGNGHIPSDEDPSYEDPS